MLSLDTTLKTAGARVRVFDTRTLGFGIGRTVIAVAQLTIMLGTHTSALFASILGEPDSPHCVGVTHGSLFCIAGEGHLLIKQCIAAVILIVIATGWRPRWTCIPHAWVSFSILSSISLPDGGDSIAQIVSAILIPIALVDNRIWHWTTPNKPLSDSARAIAYAFTLLLRVQLGYIYFYSAIAKFGVADWANGSAEYYYVRDISFGASGFAGGLWHAVTTNAFITIGMTWGSLLIEIIIGVLLVVHRKRRIALGLDLVLHIGIIVTLGLWSFALVMIGAVTIATYGETQRRRPENVAHRGSVNEVDWVKSTLPVTP